jgi:hypothetical protein
MTGTPAHSRRSLTWCHNRIHGDGSAGRSIRAGEGAEPQQGHTLDQPAKWAFALASTAQRTPALHRSRSALTGPSSRKIAHNRQDVVEWRINLGMRSSRNTRRSAAPRMSRIAGRTRDQIDDQRSCTCSATPQERLAIPGIAKIDATPSSCFEPPPACGVILVWF